jgi:hypothetical protein
VVCTRTETSRLETPFPFPALSGSAIAYVVPDRTGPPTLHVSDHVLTSI